MRLRALPVALAVAVSACGGSAANPSDAGDAGRDSSTADSSNGDAGWTQCVAPSGVAVCGGPSMCPADSSSCAACGVLANGTADGPLNPCENIATIQYGKDTVCPDGTIYAVLVNSSSNTFLCAPWDLGVLYAKNGSTDRVRYADMGIWTGAELPAPNVCQSISNVELCGGNCGGCSQVDDTCTGRSPLHPFGFCVPSSATNHCARTVAHCGWGDAGIGSSCLTFTVEASAQVAADKNGLCLPSQLCQDLATGLPGGAECTP